MLGPTAWSEDDELTIERCRVADLAARFGTPLYVYSQTQLLQNLQRFQESFAAHWPLGPVRVLPAIKANSRLAISRLLATRTPACDLFSPGELQVALRSGFDPRLMSLNGNSKLSADLEFLRYAIANDVRLTLDDAAEFEPVERIARELGKQARVRVRMRLYLPELKRQSDLAGNEIPTSLALFIYRPGIPREALLTLGPRLIASEAVEFSGVHIHVARHHASLDYWRVVMRALARELAALKQAWNGWEPAEIDIGGGFAQTRDPCARTLPRASVRQLALTKLLNRSPDVFAPLRRRVHAASLDALRRHALRSADAALDRVDGPTIEEYAQAIGVTLADELRRHSVVSGDVALELEPGRALYGSSGIHVARVNQIKRQHQPFDWTWVITDTSESFFSGTHVEHTVFPYTVADKPLAGYPPSRRMVADINGLSCNGDRLVGGACLPDDTAVGDLLVFHDVGAYEEQSGDNFNSLPRPASVLVRDGDAELIRERETLDDLFAGERMPSWLEASGVSESAAGTSG